MTRYHLPYKLMDFFSKRWVTIAVIIIALSARSLQVVYFNTVHRDAIYQTLAMENFLSGHGISNTKIAISDISSPVYAPEVRWPPGYSLLLAPFYLLFAKNYFYAVMALCLVSAVALIFYTRNLLRVMDVPLYLINLFTLLTGFIVYNFYSFNASDSIAITLIIMALYYTFRHLKKEKFSFLSAFAIGLCLFLCALIKYLYIPVACIVPFFIIAKGFAINNTSLKKTGLFVFLLLAITIGSLLLWQQMTSGSIAYIKPLPRGFYPEQLKDFYPAIAAAFMNPVTVNMLLGYESNLTFTIFRCLQLLHLSLFITAIWITIRRLLKYKFRESYLAANYFYLFFAIISTLILLLVALSLRVAGETSITGQSWTYVQEPRYYGLIDIMMHLGVFVVLSALMSSFRIRYKYLPVFLLLLILPESFRGFYFTAKRIACLESETYPWQKEYKIQQYAAEIINKEARKKNKPSCIIGSFDINIYVGAYSSIPVIQDRDGVQNIESLNTSKPVTVLAILSETDLQMHPAFAEENKNNIAGKFAGYYFYIIHVNKH